MNLDPSGSYLQLISGKKQGHCSNGILPLAGNYWGTCNCHIGPHPWGIWKKNRLRKWAALSERWVIVSQRGGKFQSHRIHVWNIYLHLVDFYGKCIGKCIGKYTIHGWHGWYGNLASKVSSLCNQGNTHWWLDDPEGKESVNTTEKTCLFEMWCFKGPM